METYKFSNALVVDDNERQCVKDVQEHLVSFAELAIRC